MGVTSLRLQQFRSFVDMEPMELGPINVLVGANNAGKSSLLRGLYCLQAGSQPWLPDVRVGATTAIIEVGFDDDSRTFFSGTSGPGVLTMTVITKDRRGGSADMQFVHADGKATVPVSQVVNIDPDHFVVPYLSKRKASTYHEDVRSQHAMTVLPHLSFLAAKLSRISNPAFPGSSAYTDTCKEILGFVVTAIPSEGGQQPGIYLPNREAIPIDQMGDGVPNIVGLLADLALSEGKLFLVEEPENDLHPKALKALLDLIVQSSRTNQFVVSTHSNIVLRHLGAVESCRVYNVTAEPGVLPTVAEVREVEHTPQARLEILRDLGYSFSDFDLWDGWLILEESSAERIIRDYLIPWFAPKLSRVRTLAVGGAGQVEATFEDFHRLVRFTHLEVAYVNKAWVRIDGDDDGKSIVQRLQKQYPTWAPDHFACFTESQFEKYYPTQFDEKVRSALSVTDKQSRRQVKRALLYEVVAWLDADTARGREAISHSAKEVIDDLVQIERQLLQGSQESAKVWTDASS